MFKKSTPMWVLQPAWCFGSHGQGETINTRQAVVVKAHNSHRVRARY